MRTGRIFLMSLFARSTESAWTCCTCYHANPTPDQRPRTKQYSGQCCWHESELNPRTRHSNNVKYTTETLQPTLGSLLARSRCCCLDLLRHGSGIAQFRTCSADISHVSSTPN